MITVPKYVLEVDVSVGANTDTKWERVCESVSRHDMCDAALQSSILNHCGYRVVHHSAPFGVAFSYTTYLVRDGGVVYDNS